MAMTLHPTDQMQRALDDLAQANNQSRSDVIHAAVLEKWERERYLTLVDEATKRMIDQWGPVLDRLGKA